MTNPYICPECWRLGAGHSEFSKHTAVPTVDGECPLCGYRGDPVTQNEINMTIVPAVFFVGVEGEPEPDDDYRGEYDAV